MSNNPFLEQSAPAHSRFPDISSPGPQLSPAPSWQPQPDYSQQASPYQQQQQPSYNGSMQPQATGWPGAGGGSGFMGAAPMQAPMRTGFQPTSSFGQQMAAHLQTGNMQQQQPSYGGGGMGYQPTGMSGQWGGQQQQQQQPNWNEISQFDPYSQLSRLETNTQTSGVGLFGSPTSSTAQTPGGYGSAFAQQQQPQQQQQTGALNMPTPQGGAGAQHHPRDWVQAHKRELEMWDPYAWKQLMNSFDGLKSAWEARKGEAEARARALGQSINYDYTAAQEFQMLQGVAKEAENNYDTTAAAAFQTLEVHESYRQSGDLASKRRVKESINAALQSLPQWPQ